MTAISENYKALQSTWTEASSATKDMEMRSHIGGVDAQMEKFYFGVQLGSKLLNMVDNLSRALQSSTISACEGQKLVKLTVSTLQSIRNEEAFDLFWAYIESKRAQVDVGSATLPRKRKAPK